MARPQMQQPRWHWSSFEALSVEQLHALLKLRQDVFVIEQSCLYPDIDGRDPRCLHLLGFGTDDTAGELVAYLRLIPPAGDRTQPALGRIATALTARGNGYGRALINEGIREARERWPDAGVVISAQTYLESLYKEFGFRTQSEPYDEDGISHIDMLLPS